MLVLCTVLLLQSLSTSFYAVPCLYMIFTRERIHKKMIDLVLRVEGERVIIYPSDLLLAGFFQVYVSLCLQQEEYHGMTVVLFWIHGCKMGC